MRIRSSPERRGSSGTERISAREMHGKCARGALPALRWLFPRATAQRRNGKGNCSARNFPRISNLGKPTIADLRRSASGGRSLARDYFTAASSEGTPFPRELRVLRNPSMRVFLGKNVAADDRSCFSDGLSARQFTLRRKA